VSVDTLVDALVQAEEDRVAQAVEDDELTQGEADERLADVVARVTERVNSADLDRGGHGHRGDGTDEDRAPRTDLAPRVGRRRSASRSPPCSPSYRRSRRAGRLRR
jgi:hypothetical protein